MPEVIIANTAIRQDAQGRYCLNDLHVAAGAHQRHRPNFFLSNRQTKALLDELVARQTAGYPAVSAIEPLARIEGRTGGTFVAKQLVYAYAMWVSPAFHLEVIDAYDQLVNGELTQHANYWFTRRPHWPAIRNLVLAGQRYREIAATVGRSPASVANAVRRMIEVGLLAPASVAQAQRGPARLAAQRRIPGWGQQQLAFDWDTTGSAA